MSTFPRFLISFLVTTALLRWVMARGIGANDYDQKNIFDRSGHLRQVEFADKAISHNSANLCCIQLKDGILFISSLKRPVSRLIKSKVPRVMMFHNDRILAAGSGLSFDIVNVFNTLKGLLQHQRVIFPTWQNWLKDDSSQLLEELSHQYSKHLYHKNDLYSEETVRDDDFEHHLHRVPGVNLLLAGMAPSESALRSETESTGQIILIRPDGCRSQHKAIAQGNSAAAIANDLSKLFDLNHNDFAQVDIDEAIRRVASSGFLKRYFCSSNEDPLDLNALDPAENQNKEVHEQIDNHLEVYAMYTKHNKAMSPKPLLGIWHRVNLRSVAK